MAISYIHAGTLSRTHGRRATQFSAYISNTKVFDYVNGKTDDYTNKDDCVYTNILLPASAYIGNLNKDNHPFNSREALWNAVETKENTHNRKASAQLAVTFEIALPKELAVEDNKKLLDQFIQENYINKYGLVAEVAIHDKSDGNPHGHVMLGLRELNGVEFNNKKRRDVLPPVRELNGRLLINTDGLNKKYVAFQNRFFRENSINLVVDQDRIIPIVHMRRSRFDGTFLGEDIALNSNIGKQNLDKVSSDHNIIIDTLASRQTTFNRADIESLVYKCTMSDSQSYDTVLSKVLESNKLMVLGYSTAGRMTYTTQENYSNDLDLLKMVSNLDGKHSFSINDKLINKVGYEKGLFEEQVGAVRHLTQSGDIACLVGFAGTGKTYTMNALNEVYKKAGVQVSGVSVSGKAVQGLEDEAGISSQTISKILLSYSNGHENNLPPKKSVLVIDEAGMVGLDDMLSLVRMAKARDLKLILAGDPKQLEAISRGNPFKAILERTGFFEMKDIQRQVDILDQVATRNLGLGDTGKAIDYYHDKGNIHIQNTENNIKDIVAKYSSLLDQSYYDKKLEKNVNYQVKDTLMLTYTRADVNSLNVKARDVLLARGLISDSVDIQISLSSNKNNKNDYSTKSFGVGERIIFLQNKTLNTGKVKNGLFGDIKAIKGDIVTVITDEHKPRELQININEYNSFDHGYAVTVHKSQGASVQNTLGYVSNTNWDSHLTYVAMSRHKRNMELYVDNGAYKDLDSLRRGLSSKSKKESNVLDFVHKIEANRLVSKLHALKGGKGEKYGLNQEVLDANTKFAIVAELADVTRDVGREYYKLLGESDSRELSDDSQAVLQKRYAYRNELAYKVATNFEELAVAIEHNNLDLSQISKWSDNHIAETNFEKFINSSDVLYKGSIAESISKTQRGKMLLSKHDKWQEYSQCLGEFKLDGLITNNVATKEDVTLVDRYLGYRDEAYSYYKKTQEEYFDIGDKELEQMLTGYRNEANALNKKADVVAYQIVNNLEHYKQIIEAKYTGKMFDNVINSIERQARYQECREDVEKYKHAKGLTREQFAYRISVNGKEYARFVAEAQVDWKDINKDSIRLRLEAFRDDLDGGIKPIFDAMQEYKETGSKIFEIMSLSLFETRTQEDKQDIATLVTKRNQQANDLLFIHGLSKYGNDDRFLKKLHPSGIDVDKLFKQYESHKENLIAKQTVDRYSEALNTKVDILSANSLAHQITSKYGVHAKHFKQHNIDTRDLNKKSWHHQLYLDNGQFNGVDKQLHRDISDYLIAKNEASIAWMQAKQEKGANKDLILLKAKHLSQNRNELAYKVSQGLGQTPNSKAYELFEFSSFFDKGKRSDIDLQALVKSAKEHELIIKLKEYGELKPLTNGSKSLAYDISRQYSKGAIFYTLQQLELNSKDFYIDKKAFEREMDVDKEFAHAKVDFELYKKSSGIANYQGKIADRIISNQSNLKLLDRSDINYNNINIHALEYRLENYISSKDARVIEKLDFERINRTFKASLNNYSHIFGSKTKETANIIYFGKFSVSKESGKWWDDNQSAYRDPTEAMMKVHGTRHKQTGENYAEFVGRVAGLEKDQLRFKEVVDPVKNQLQNDLADFKEKVHKQQAVQMLWDSSQPLEGTIADRYLKEHRGIIDTSSLAMRYLPKGTDIMLSSGKIKPAHAPMLLVGGYNAKGEIVSAQRIYLDEKTANKNTQMDNPKLSMGLVSGSGGLVQKGTSDKVYIVEGPETGASIAIADKEASVYCSFGLGNLSKLDSLIKANNYKEVILAADNDGIGSNAERLTKEAQQQLEKKGIKLTVIEPKAIEGLAKTDWNDVLKAKGIAKVQKQLGIAPKEQEYSKKYIKAKELMDKLEKLQTTVEINSKWAKYTNQPIIFKRLSEEEKKKARFAKVTLSTFTKQRDEALKKFEDKRHMMPNKIRKTEQFKQLNEMVIRREKEFDNTHSRSMDYSMDR